jgi:hypothetical protein
MGDLICHAIDERTTLLLKEEASRQVAKDCAEGRDLLYTPHGTTPSS